MLLGLTIRDVVLIDRLALAFRPGLCVLTGETGAGKSILLDALGLALGRRAASRGREPTPTDASRTFLTVEIDFRRRAALEHPRSGV